MSNPLQSMANTSRTDNQHAFNNDEPQIQDSVAQVRFRTSVRTRTWLNRTQSSVQGSGFCLNQTQGSVRGSVFRAFRERLVNAFERVRTRSVEPTADPGIQSAESSANASQSNNQNSFNRVRGVTNSFNVETHTHVHQSSKGMEVLTASVAPGAFHNSAKRSDPPRCHENTRQEVLRRLVQWAQREGDLEALMICLYGIVGVGKSAIQQTFAERCESLGILLASFFFSRDDESRNEATAFVATLVYQITVNLPSARPFIEPVFESDPLIFSRSTETQVARLIIEPLQQLPISNFTHVPYVIIVDGLDECKKEHRSQVIQAISSVINAFRHCSPALLVVFSSRPEWDIKDTFTDHSTSIPMMEIDLNKDYVAHEDIHTFLTDGFSRLRRGKIPDTWPSDDDFNTILHRSSGQFIYAATVYKFLSSRHHTPRSGLKVILGTSPVSGTSPFAALDDLYCKILTDLPEDTLSNSLLLLATLVALGGHSQISDLTVLFGLDKDEIELLVDNLGSFLSHHGEDVAIPHISVGEFLADVNRSKEFYQDPTLWCSAMSSYIDCSRSSSDLLSRLTDVGASYQHTHILTRSVDNINSAILYQQYAVDVALANNTNKALCLDSLGSSLHWRFNCTGVMTDIVSAISYIQQAVDLTPPNHPDLPRQLANLGNSYRVRFNHGGDIDDLKLAISYHQQALDLTPSNHPDRPIQLANLGSSYRALFNHGGNMDDLKLAISHQQQALDLTPPNHPDLPVQLANLGTSYRALFNHGGNMDDLKSAISHEQKALDLTPPNHPDLPIRLANLGRSYRSRFNHGRNMDDLKLAISYQQKALDLTPPNHPELPIRLTDLGVSHWTSFNHGGNMDDLKLAISHVQQAVNLFLLSHIDRAGAVTFLDSLHCLAADSTITI